MKQTGAGGLLIPTLRAHWAILLVMVIVSLLFGPMVAKMRPMGDTEADLWANRNWPFWEVVRQHIWQTGGPLGGLSKPLLFGLLDFNQPMARLLIFSLHLGGCLLLYSLVMRLSGSVWLAAAVAAMFGVIPLISEALFWYEARLYVISTFFVLWAAVASVNPKVPTARRNVVVFCLLFIAVLFCEQSGPVAVGLALGLWLVRADWARTWRQVLPAWFAGPLSGFAVHLGFRYLFGCPRVAAWHGSLELLRSPFRHWMGRTVHFAGGQHLLAHPELSIVLISFLAVVAIAVVRTRPSSVRRVRGIIIPCLLAFAGGIAPFMFNTYFPGRALYNLAPWVALALVILAHTIFRRAAVVAIILALAMATVATLGSASTFLVVNRAQEQYFAAFEKVLPDLPSGVRRIWAKNAVQECGPWSVYEDTWSLQAALATLYNIGPPGLEVWSRRGPCPYPPETIDLIVVWHPESRKMEVIWPRRNLGQSIE